MIALEPNAAEWIRLESVDSTNSFVMREDLRAGTVVIADRQTAGRGRYGRTWVSRGGSLIFSGLLVFDSSQMSDEKLGLFPVLTGVALLRALESLRPGETFALKEPNDIIVTRETRGKVAGILVESEIRSDRRRVIIGVGVNGTQAPEPSQVEEAAYPPAALCAKGEEFDRDECARRLIREFNARIGQLLQSQTPAFLGEAAEHRLVS